MAATENSVEYFRAIGIGGPGSQIVVVQDTVTASGVTINTHCTKAPIFGIAKQVGGIEGVSDGALNVAVGAYAVASSGEYWATISISDSVGAAATGETVSIVSM